MKRAVIFVLIFAAPVFAQEQKPRLLFGVYKPEPDCVFLEQRHSMGAASLWACPPSGQNTVSVEQLQPRVHPKRNAFARGWHWLVRR